jgi:isopenicillin N synthase-like dioxygenase
VDRVSKELDAALSTVGFVYLKNHGIQKEVIEQSCRTAKQFFTLPDATKSKHIRLADKSSQTEVRDNGYVAPGQEILESKNRHEVREAYDVTCLSGYFPDKDEPEFRTSVNRLVPQLCQLSNRLLICLATALGLEEDYFTRCHTGMCQGKDKNPTTFRTLFYPSLADSDIQAGVERCGAHSDYGTITLLFQDDMGGLELLSAGQWVPAKPIADTILVNVGDLMQFWTADRYLATVHRVRIPEEELRRRSPRQSIAFFVHPDNQVMVSPLNGSSAHPPISALAHLELRLSQTYKY